ncbi:MAG TPA: pyrroloquinoline quinone biosynthesis peptide chaperone PqqD [Steroidobacteraceae bacterium]|nr:pyrroloquinoline quinone biosynthesis peptide chaperone PqqD [Steroidobacteraceae bacterium]
MSGAAAGGAGVAADARPAIPRGLKLQWEAAQAAHVLLFPEGQVLLNGSAAEIMSRCDGVRTVAEIVADIERTHSLSGIADDVGAFVALALAKRWLELRP